MKTGKIVIIGATSLIAEHCARLWAENHMPGELVLVGRDEDKLNRVAADLAVRSPASQITTQVTDFVDPDAIEAFVQQTCKEGVPGIVLVAHGYMPEQQASQADPGIARTVIEVNAISPVLFAEAFAGHMENTGGNIAVIGSVAGDRGRRSNYIYGSAKGMVARYIEGMQHRFAGTDLHVAVVKPGPTRTPMTMELHSKGLKLAPVEDVAKDIVNGIARNRNVIYTPGKWFFIMLIIRHMPRFIFNKMDI